MSSSPEMDAEFEDSTEPNEWDEFFYLTHKNTRPVEEEVDDTDELDFEPIEFDED